MEILGTWLHHCHSPKQMGGVGVQVTHMGLKEMIAAAQKDARRKRKVRADG